MDPSDVRILVVEDDAFTRIATIDILQSCKYNVSAVENGKEALQTLQQSYQQYDLVLCDVMLPCMTGIELLEAIQAHPTRFNHIPIVMTSCNEGMDVVKNCLSKGAKDYLIKPIQVNTAKTLVRHVWLHRQQHSNQQNAQADSSERVPCYSSIWQNLHIIRQIGKGTHGNIMLAKRKEDGAIVAIKRIQTADFSEQGKKQADNEVVLLKSLYHVNIVRFYDHFMLGDELNIVMEYSDGGNLRQLIKLRARDEMGPFPETVIMSWFAQLVLAVAYIHGKNVLHRDLKAQNVFLTRKNVIKLGDFGISKALSDDVTANTACGTPESMSPEICRSEPYGKKSDVWSLGCILYELIMLSRPFEAKSLSEIFTKICKAEYNPIPQRFSRELRLLVQLMLQLDPSKRPTIDDICRFPFVQAPIQTFLSAHVSEFQEALELEAKLHQPSLFSADTSIDTSNRSELQQESLKHFVDNQQIMQSLENYSENETLKAKLKAESFTFNLKDGACQLSSSKEMLDDQVSMKSVSVHEGTLEAHKMSPETSWNFSSISKSLPTSEYQEMDFADNLRGCVCVQDIRNGLFSAHVACISGVDLIRNLKCQLGKSGEEAFDLLNVLLHHRRLKLIVADDMNEPDFACTNTLFRFQVDDVSEPLNMRYIHNYPAAENPMQVALEARLCIKKIHESKQYPDRISTGFRGFQTVTKYSMHRHRSFTSKGLHMRNSSGSIETALSSAYRHFLRSVAKLQTVELNAVSKHDRQAFFINVYNTMVLHGMIEYGIPQYSSQYRKFERDVQYQIGEYKFTLSDLKHGIIRCNRKPPRNYWERQLQPQDPRLQFRLHIRDPRSLLVLIEPCEPLIVSNEAAIIHTGRTDTDLEEQVGAYCARRVEVHVETQEVVLPRLFRVFHNDFGATERDMISWLGDYVPNVPVDFTGFRIKYAGGITC
uniref:non-specific serine/threonine protein kinase n=1 Tax=Albugo laibachii Nc14 TaxID=890382 RepID=F0VZJ5_9STRA|nr:protein kinase putative [Albugo laibachii Nc14]|eukprot:CCA14225.1 protein kinase putative [Albugo laibachii Nc14]